MHITTLPAGRAGEANAVLCEAFRDYPFMRWVLSSSADRYGAHLRRLIGFFTHARVLRDDPILAVTTPGDEVVAVATLTRPGDPSPAALGPLRETLWTEIGPDAQERYERHGGICAGFEIDAPHYHLAMLGVRRRQAGQGLGRLLLDAVHDRSSADPASSGVTLNTEDPANVPLYEHVGYRVIGEAAVSNDLRTWAFYRPDPAGP